MELVCIDSLGSLDGATLILGVMEGMEPAPGSEAGLDGVDLAVASVQGFEAKSGQLLVLPHTEAEAAILVGLGEEASFESIRSASGSAARSVKTERAITALAGIDVEQASRAVGEGTLLGTYKFTDYKTDAEAPVFNRLEILGGDVSQVDKARQLSEATFLARDWVNTPAMDLSPEEFASRVSDIADSSGLEVEVWDLARISDENLGGVLGVAAGSSREPRVVILKHRPEGAKAHLALVGKGITFDSGGLSLKSAAFMEDMKDDMAGAAAVLAATIGIARLGIPVSVTAITPLTDNAVGGNATRPGDVLRPLEGPTIEVLNTDAEGRLVLADGLGLAKRHEPDLTVDVATLTGAAAVALGKQIAAVFGSDSTVSSQVLEAAGRAGEPFWEMPLHRGYRKSLDSNIADIKNISGSRYGGAIVAALFLAEYAGDGPWAHLDIAGPARSTETNGEIVKGATGVSVRTLIELAEDLGQTD